MSGEIDIKGLDAADVLVALYNSSAPRGMGFMQSESGSMGREEAAELLKQVDYFDYLRGVTVRQVAGDGNVGKDNEND